MESSTHISPLLAAVHSVVGHVVTALHTDHEDPVACMNDAAIQYRHDIGDYEDLCVETRVDKLRLAVQDASRNFAHPMDVCAAFGIAALKVFLQANVTGTLPRVGENPFCPTQGIVEPQDWVRKVQSNAATGTTGLSSDDVWACNQLSADGEEIFGRALFPQYLVVALIALAEPLGVVVVGADHRTAPQSAGLEAKKGVTSLGACPGDAQLQKTMQARASRMPALPWWAARAVVLQQRILAGSSLSLQRALVHLWAAAATQFDLPCPQAQAVQVAVNNLISSPNRGASDRVWRCLSAAIHMEIALTWHMYHRPRDAAMFLSLARRDLAVCVSVVGALGVRTEAQQVAKAQLVLDVQRDEGGGDEWDDDEAAAVRPRVAEDDESWAGWRDESEVFEVPKLVGDARPNGATVIPSVEQMLLLCTCNHVQRAAARDALTSSELAPYVDAVLSQPSSRFIAQAMAMLLQARHEMSRPRVRERALLRFHMLQSSMLAETVPVGKRMILAFTSCFPTYVQLRRELADVWVGAGMVAAALSTYEELQLWEQLIACYMLLGKKAAAEVLIKGRLEADPGNPKLYNAMGDLTKSDSWYEQAWEVSKQKDARSQRSLARNALSRKDFAKAVSHFKLALDRNPLNAESWFSLGYCHLKLDDSFAAIQAFTRCVQLEPDNGEAWNNIGILHLQARHFRPAKCALGVALKHKPQNWQIADNFSLAAVKTGEAVTAANSMLRTLELSRGQRVHAEVLELLVDAVVRGRGAPGEVPDDSAVAANPENDSPQGLPRIDEEQEEAFLQDLAALGTLESDEAILGGDPSSQDVSAVAPLDPTTEQAAAPHAPHEQLQAEFAATEGVEMPNGSDWEADAAIRQRKLLESAVEKCVKGAVAVENPSAAAWRLMARFYSTTQDYGRAKDAALACLRLLQTPGWQNDAASVMAVAECAQGLARLLKELAASVTDVAEKRREVASVRLQIASLSKVASQALGDDDPGVVALQRALAETQALQADLKPAREV